MVVSHYMCIYVCGENKTWVLCKIHKSHASTFSLFSPLCNYTHSSQLKNCIYFSGPVGINLVLIKAEHRKELRDLERRWSLGIGRNFVGIHDRNVSGFFWGGGWDFFSHFFIWPLFLLLESITNEYKLCLLEQGKFSIIMKASTQRQGDYRFLLICRAIGENVSSAPADSNSCQWYFGHSYL